MANFWAEIPDLVIASGGSSSRWVDSVLETADAVAIGIMSPASAEATEFEVSEDKSTVFRLQFENAAGTVADVQGPTATNARSYPPFPFKYWRLVTATGTVAADRTFKVHKLFNSY